jgi:hypothetical protein
VAKFETERDRLAHAGKIQLESDRNVAIDPKCNKDGRFQPFSPGNDRIC